jgi:HD superfamily phosphohydrolase YqeK
MRRVADLLDGWARAAGLDAEERARWRAMGHLHDACKGVPADELRGWLGGEAAGIPDPVLHGPAAARRLRDDGVDDEALTRAVAWHTLGHPELGPEGMALYAGDFLEPGRDLRNAWRAGLRARLPGELEAVTREILRARIEHLLRRDRPVHPTTMAFWNRLAEGARWAPASEV